MAQRIRLSKAKNAMARKITRLLLQTLFKNAEFVTATQKVFRTCFGLNPNKGVPDRKTILKWIHNIKTTGLANPKNNQ